jgi:N utilization substance protein B
MAPRQQPRRIARELALLGLSQIKGSVEKLEQNDLNNFVLAAIRALTSEIEESLETASADVTRAHERLLNSETRATNIQSAKAMIVEALECTQSAINRLASTIELPEAVQLASQHEVRQYAIELIGAVHRRHKEIEEHIQAGMVDWKLHRLPQVERNILRIAVAEMLYLDIPHKVAINEAIELAKRYSDEEGYRFINGVLRRVIEKLK